MKHLYKIGNTIRYINDNGQLEVDAAQDVRIWERSEGDNTFIIQSPLIGYESVTIGNVIDGNMNPWTREDLLTFSQTEVADPQGDQKVIVNNSEDLGVKVTRGDFESDSFGALRVSQKTIQIDLKNLTGLNPDEVDTQTIGGASIVHSEEFAEARMTVGSSGDAAISQTLVRGYYQSAFSGLRYWTFRRFGNGNNITIKVSRSGTETASIARADWFDSMDGTGASGINHDFNTNTIIAADFEYLGIGGIRYFLVSNFGTFLIHAQNFTNSDGVYMSSPHQPLRWECRQTGPSSFLKRVGYFSSGTVSPFNSDLDGFWLESNEGTGEFNYICSSVSSEGSTNKIGKPRTANTRTDDMQLNSSGTLYAIAGIRLQSNRLNSIVDLFNFNFMAETNDRSLIELYIDPTITGTFNYSPVSDSVCETAFGNQQDPAPTLSGGRAIRSFYVLANDKAESAFNDDVQLRLGARIDGTPVNYVFATEPINPGLDAFCAINWNEF